MTVWDHILGGLREKLEPIHFETWLLPTSFTGYDPDSGLVRVEVPNEHFRSYLEQHYLPLIQEAADKVTGRSVEVEISVSGDSPPVREALRVEPQTLIPHFTFENFVVGSSNQFAHAAAWSVAEGPSRMYNPLFIYGGTGLGKTHLLQAIGHQIQHQHPRLRLRYISSEKFMNELISAIRYDHTPLFRDRYRRVDVLLVDDIQFLAGKDRTQVEFFHTFNELYESQRQIVISSDAPPRDIPKLEERLHSRFEWGLLADIQPPDLETKIAILTKKAASEGIQIDADVALLIATSVRSNVRELEGSLKRVSALAALTNRPIDETLVKQALQERFASPYHPISPDAIIKLVSDYFNIKPAILKNKSNKQSIVQARQLAMYLCKEITPLSLPEIGRTFGGKHHSTVIHSIRKVQKRRESDPSFNRLINSFNESLR
ncbi:MAG TPA: chromosomal replication initiator protein DnaA [Acidobacteriota bacterium]